MGWDRAASTADPVTDSTVIEPMPSFYPVPTGTSAPAARMQMLQRRPQRVTATMSWQLHQRLQQRADEEGRSLSNLVTFLLEAATAA